MQMNESRQLAIPVPMTNIPPGAPIFAVPVQMIVHQTRYIEQHTVTRHPIMHVYPTHIHRVHHDIYEHYCEFPCNESQEVCKETINCCPAPMTTGES